MTHETLVKEIAPDTLSYLLGEKLKRVDTDASLRDAAQSLYSAPFEEIRAMIFVPQAERDILTSRLFLEGKTFETWLTDAKRQAHVYILKPGFVWDGETVKAK